QIEQAEDFLRSLGFVEFRVRHHGDIARIEVPASQIQQITAEQTRQKVTAGLKAMGFKFITIDLQGFRSGSLNETLTPEEKRKHR
ncbi:MAG: TIGR00268 family protein, partial [Planctomycetota bacterium]